MKNIWKYAVILGIILLLYALWKGCQNSASRKDYQVTPKINERLERLQKDSAQTHSELNDLHFSYNLLQGQFDLLTNKNITTTDSLSAANDRITLLRKRHVDIEPSHDTSATLVPNEYLSDCASCFAELDNGQRLVLKYKEEKDGLQKILSDQLSIKDKEASVFRSQISDLKNTLIDVTEIAKRNEKKNEPRRTLYFSLATISVNNKLPTGIGGGLLYMDKRMRIFGANYYINNTGPVWQAQLSMPLSLKRR